MNFKTKTTLFATVLFTSIFFVACDSSSTEDVMDSIDETITETIDEITDYQPTDTSNCFRDDTIQGEIAIALMQTYEYIQGTYSGTPVNPKQLSRSFDKNLVDSLLNSCPTCDGVRVYFGYSDPTTNIPTSPELIMVNTNGCDALTDLVLVSSKNDNGSFMSLNQAADMTKNWQDAVERNLTVQDNWPLRGTPFKEIYAYTFKRSTFELNPNYNPSAVHIHYTMRIDEGTPATTGLYGELEIDLVVENMPLFAPEANFYDMAFPCPRECGTSNALYVEYVNN